ncbi:hypothetical protein N7528_005501 [Penicillium herquei]|nr:hypothetical protein N7528_005501 [Penicillium herquei]
MSATILNPRDLFTFDSPSMIPPGMPKMQEELTDPNIDPQLAPPRRTSRRYSNMSVDRAKHLERNRIAANKCRQKKKKRQEEIQHTLSEETEKHEALLSTIDCLKEQVWHLKNIIFDHVSCDDPQINLQLAKYSERAAQNTLGAAQCPSPTFSASTVSDKSSGLGDGDFLPDANPPGATPAMMVPEKTGYGYDDFPDFMFDNFVQAD